MSRRIRAERVLKHAGTAQIRLQNLAFPNSDGPNSANVKRLEKLFRGQRGCNPGDVYNRIPAVIEEGHLQAALAASGLSSDALLADDGDHPRLVFSNEFRLECLRGEDRVRAAENVLSSRDPYWVVDLFIASTCNRQGRPVNETNPNETNPFKTSAKKLNEN